ncbi:MAG TPA: diphthine--ammonia ligase [Candidatus Bathyarchaeia archaeon]|nr:diphthine--ammonia ligase [Candidatus Bathyarchaeia archaeon]
MAKILRVASLISGGKDSALALYRGMRQGYEIEYLVAMVPEKEDSWMFHYPNIHLVDLFAEAANIRLCKGKTKGIKEAELEDLKLLLKKLDVKGIISGAVSSEYQKTRIERICHDLHLTSITPLWHEDPLKLLRELVDLNFETIIVGVYAYGFTREWLGRTIDAETIDELVHLNREYQISMVGEGGEYETLVLDAPFFEKKIKLLEVEKTWEGQSGYLSVKDATVLDKGSPG